MTYVNKFLIFANSCIVVITLEDGKMQKNIKKIKICKKLDKLVLQKVY